MPQKHTLLLLTNSILSTIFLLILSSTQLVANASGGQWKLLQQNIGIVAMHMQLLHNDRVVILDRTDFGKSNLTLPNGKCRNDSTELVLKLDCTAHSIEYNVLTNTFRALMVQTNVWCSSGAVFPDGRLIQTGGFNDGDHKVRIFTPCEDGGCDWVEMGDGIKNRRWYATNQILPDGRQIIIGGRRQYNYEFYPKKDYASGVYLLRFLVQTNDPGVENNLYPFVFLNVDGNLFIFANNRAILFDYNKYKVVRTYPDVPGGDPRCYPSTGSAVLLPIKDITIASKESGGNNNAQLVEVLVCGGTPKDSYNKAKKGNFVKALDTCGRIKVTDTNPQWVIETMPFARVMGDMTLLPNGNVFIVNGGDSGTAGWEYGRNPVLNPVLYQPNKPVGSRFVKENPSTIPRMYHSTAILVRDGRVLVGGSNPHEHYKFSSGVLFPTELRLEAFYPPYLDSQFDNIRPKIVSPLSTTKIGYGQMLVIKFQVTGSLTQDFVSVTMIFPSFTTHSFSMNQRLIELVKWNLTRAGSSLYNVHVTTPGSSNLAPSGYYMLFVVHQEIPSEGIWVQIE